MELLGELNPFGCFCVVLIYSRVESVLVWEGNSGINGSAISKLRVCGVMFMISFVYCFRGRTFKCKILFGG